MIDAIFKEGEHFENPDDVSIDKGYLGDGS
jgi:hypothetical protein